MYSIIIPIIAALVLRMSMGLLALGKTKLTATQTLAIAAKEIGYKEQGGRNKVKYWTDLKPEWYNQNAAWCAAYVLWVLTRAGVDMRPHLQWSLRFWVGAWKQWAQQDGRWRGPNATPEPGWLVVYGNNAHIGIVERDLPGTYIQTIEGNTSSGLSGSQNNGDGVYRRKRYTGRGTWVDGYIDMSGMWAKGPAKPVASYPKISRQLYLRTPQMHGSDVKRLQSEMKRVLKSSVEVDGYFGPNTRRFVMYAQKALKVKADGYVGPKTLAAMRAKGMKV